MVGDSEIAMKELVNRGGALNVAEGDVVMPF